MFFSFYSIFCLGSTKNEVHICNLHAKTQLLMYDKGGLSTKKFSSPEGRWRTVRKPGLDENSGFEWKNLYFLYQWPKRNSFQGYSSPISKKVLFWHPLITNRTALSGVWCLRLSGTFNYIPSISDPKGKAFRGIHFWFWKKCFSETP